MEPATSPRTLKFGPFQVDLRAGELRRNSARIRLQEKPLRLLAALAERHGQVVTRGELKQRLWPDETFVDFETGLNTAVSKLRSALSDTAESPRFIETIPRRGYRFLMPVEISTDNGHSIEVLHPIAASDPPSALQPVMGTPRPDSPDRATQVHALAARRLSFGLQGWLWLGAAVAILAGGAYWLLRSSPALSFRSRDTFLITDFENQTGDPRFEQALGTAFAVSVEQSRYANVFPRTRIETVLGLMGKSPATPVTPSIGREICQREGIRGLVALSITRTGQEYELTAQLIDPQTGETVRSNTERSFGEDHILEALDVLAKETREALGESLYQIHQADRPLPQVTTRSLAALQQYADGTALWHNGRYADAVTLFKEAVATDPDFAMAHAALGRAYYSYIYNQQEDGQKQYEKALSLLSRATEREHMEIETNYAVDRTDQDAAYGLLRAYLDRYPDDLTRRYDYAKILGDMGRDQESINQFKQVLEVAPDFAHAYIGIAESYKGLNDFSDSVSAYSKAFEIDPRWRATGSVNREFGFTLVADGEDHKAEQVFSELLGAEQTRENGLRSLAFLDLYHGRYASARRRLDESLQFLAGENSPISVARVHLLLATVDEGFGESKGQLQQLDAAAAELPNVQPKVMLGAYIGDAYARAGWTAPASRIDAMIRPMADSKSLEQMGYLHLLEGEIALADRQNAKAIDLLETSDKEYRSAFSQEAVAHAYQQSGDVTHAIANYQDMLPAKYKPLGWEPQQRWLEARFMLAQDYAAQGNRDKALQTLAPLLDLWKDADANLILRRESLALQSRLAN